MTLDGFDIALQCAGISPFVYSIDDEISEQIILALEDDDGSCPVFLDYVNNFQGFCTDILGVYFWDGQGHMAALVERYPKVAIAACYGSGKTFFAACLAVWWLWTRRPCLCVSTAPTGRQVRDLLWAEMRKIHLGAKVNLGGRILLRETRIALDRRGLGFSGDKPNSVAGYHERENILFIEDESAGMKREVVQGYDGLTATSGSKWVKIGNPIAEDGPFWDCFNDDKERLIWQTYEISAYCTPNVRGKTALQIGFAPAGGLSAYVAWDVIAESIACPGLVSYPWVKERERKWGPEHPLFITKVLGQWYFKAGALSVIPLEWVKLACRRWKEYLEGGTKFPILGVDVGGGVGRDNTSCVLRDGRKASVVGRANDKDLPDQADWLDLLCRKHRVKRLCVDGTGLGKGLYDICRRLKRGGKFQNVDICLVKMGNKPTKSGEQEFDLLVDQIWWDMRRAFDPNNPDCIAINPAEEELRDQLPHRTWTIIGDGDGVIKVERKTDMAKRGLHSPDDADALAATFFEPILGRAFAA